MASVHEGVLYDKGPDQIIPSETLTTTHADGAVKIREYPGSKVDHNGKEALSVPSLLENTAKKFPNHLAMSVKRNGEWIKWNYAQYYQVRFF